MKKFSSTFFFVLIGYTLLCCISCREDIVPPDNFAGNVNEPLEKNNYNSYTFLIDASMVNVDYSKRPDFTTYASRIIITITDYSSGSIRIKVKDSQSVNRFSYLGNNEEEFYTELLNGFIPYSIEFTANNFTGKVKIQLSGVY